MPAVHMSAAHLPATDDSPSAILSRFGDRWTIPMLHRLEQAPLPLGGLRRALPDITQRGLMMTLNALERDGLIDRIAAPTGGDEAVYALTERGRDVLPLVAALTNWARVHSEGIVRSRQDFDRARAARATILPKDGAPRRA